jgi:histidine triad (HIT) family protein
MRVDTHCTFCDLIHGAGEVSVCHEDPDAIAFMDIQPVNNGHVLVAPREHYESLLDLPEDLGIHLFRVTMRLAAAVRSVARCDGLNIVVSSGEVAGQDEPHYHVHLIPRRAGDSFDIPLPFDGSEMPDRTVLDAYAARIISYLRDPMRGTMGEPSIHTSKADREARDRAVPVQTSSELEPDAAAGLKGDEAGLDSRDDKSRERRGTGRGGWRINEGAHGELTYEPKSDSGDAT